MVPTISEVPPQVSDKPISPLQFNPSAAASSRIWPIDVIRGVAVLAALFVSIWLFGGFTENEQTGLLLRSKGWNYRLFGAVDLILNGKMTAMIAMVFGAGMILFISRTGEQGQVINADLFIRRQMWLILLGIINAIMLLWSGDILFHLGIMGILLFPFIRVNKKGLVIAACAALLIYCGKNYWDYTDTKKVYNKYLAVVAAEKKISKDSADRAKADSVAKISSPDKSTSSAKKDSAAASKKATDTLTKKQENEKGAWEGLVAGMKFDPKKDDEGKKAMRKTSYASLWNHVLPTSQQREAQWTYRTGVWELAAMILWGMALLKFGFFNARLRSWQYLCIALAGITGGLLLGWLRIHQQQLMLQDYAKYIDGHALPHNFFFPFEITAMTTGYVSLFIFLTLKRKPIWQPIASVGKMALTNYLLQTLVCTWFFTGFGLGYYGRLTQIQLYGIVAEITLLQIAFSMLWLRRYQLGPAEWLLRSLIYKKWLPNRLQDTVAPQTSQS